MNMMYFTKQSENKPTEQITALIRSSASSHPPFYPPKELAFTTSTPCSHFAVGIHSVPEYPPPPGCSHHSPCPALLCPLSANISSSLPWRQSLVTFLLLSNPPSITQSVPAGSRLVCGVTVFIRLGTSVGGLVRSAVGLFGQGPTRRYVCRLSLRVSSLTTCVVSHYVCRLSLRVSSLATCVVSRYVCRLSLRVSSLATCVVSRYVCRLSLRVSSLTTCVVSHYVCRLSLCVSSLATCVVSHYVCRLSLRVSSLATCVVSRYVCRLSLRVSSLTTCVVSHYVCRLSLRVSSLTTCVVSHYVCRLSLRVSSLTTCVVSHYVCRLSLRVSSLTTCVVSRSCESPHVPQATAVSCPAVGRNCAQLGGRKIFSLLFLRVFKKKKKIFLTKQK